LKAYLKFTSILAGWTVLSIAWVKQSFSNRYFIVMLFELEGSKKKNILTVAVGIGFFGLGKLNSHKNLKRKL